MKTSTRGNIGKRSKKDMFRKLRRWALINFNIVFLFITGTIYEVEILLVLSLIMLWFTAIAGTFLWVLTFLARRYQGKGFLIDIVEPENIPSKEEREELRLKKEFPISVETARNMAKGSVRIELDILLDILIVGMLIYFNYAWLPLFYIVQIFGLYNMKQFCKSLVLDFEQAKEK